MCVCFVHMCIRTCTHTYKEINTHVHGFKAHAWCIHTYPRDECHQPISIAAWDPFCLSSLFIIFIISIWYQWIVPFLSCEPIYHNNMKSTWIQYEINMKSIWNQYGIHMIDIALPYVVDLALVRISEKKFWNSDFQKKFWNSEKKLYLRKSVPLALALSEAPAPTGHIKCI